MPKGSGRGVDGREREVAWDIVRKGRWWRGNVCRKDIYDGCKSVEAILGVLSTLENGDNVHQISQKLLKIYWRVTRNGSQSSVIFIHIDLVSPLIGITERSEDAHISLSV